MRTGEMAQIRIRIILEGHFIRIFEYLCSSLQSGLKDRYYLSWHHPIATAAKNDIILVLTITILSVFDQGMGG